VVGVVGSTSIACGKAKGRLSIGVQLAPESVLVFSGRSPSVFCRGLTSGKFADEVLPAIQTSPALSTAIAPAADCALLPSAVSQRFVDPSGESLKEMACWNTGAADTSVAVLGSFARDDPAT
jgi:hypothetical protein